MMAYKVWNAVVWGNVAFTIFLFTTRSLYFLGAFSTTEDDLKAKAKVLKDKVEGEKKAE